MSKALAVAVAGGGAAGFFGAIAAAQNPHARVTLYEAGPEPLAKVRISGGGRCNVTHHCFEPAQLVQNYPRGGKALRGAFSRFQPKDTIAWFKQRGVKLKTEADGRMFPITDDSATIVDCLTKAAQQAGVRVKVRSPITTIQKLDDTFELGIKSSKDSPKTVQCDRLLLATGSSPIGLRVAKALGHTLEPSVPSLFTFNVADKRLHQLSGVAVDPVDLKLKAEGIKPLMQSGPLLITHWGLSGPAVLKLSAWGARALHTQKYKATLSVNWLPAMHQDAVRVELQQAKAASGKKAIAAFSPFSPISKRLWQYLLARSEIDPAMTWANLSKKQTNKLVQTLTQGSVAVMGKGTFKDEFVTCGGVKLKEVNFKTMESRLCQGLYLAGEILDIDGITGGFNFQSAWTTGWLAGQAISQGC